MKSIANYISISRILLVLTLIFIKPLSTTFYIIYFISGISDILDGFIARKYNVTSTLGEKLDSFADLIMVAVLIITLYPIINPTVQILIWVIFIGIIRIVSVIVAFFKFKTFCMLHTYANKITGFILFLFPMLLTAFPSDVLMYGICIIANLSGIEELVINLRTSKLEVNRKSIFIK